MNVQSRSGNLTSWVDTWTGWNSLGGRMLIGKGNVEDYTGGFYFCSFWAKWKGGEADQKNEGLPKDCRYLWSNLTLVCFHQFVWHRPIKHWRPMMMFWSKIRNIDLAISFTCSIYFSVKRNWRESAQNCGQWSNWSCHNAMICLFSCFALQRKKT